ALKMSSGDENETGTESEQDSGRDDNNSETETADNGEAVELIKFVQQHENAAGVKTLELNRVNLDKLLQSTEDRSLCIISIVGPTKTWKEDLGLESSISHRYFKNDIAVLLLDTQGIDVGTSTLRKSAQFLGLSFLSSSIFGVACKQVDEECSDEPPFQKLSFLIRDWNNPSQYSFGPDGTRLLKNKFKTLKGDVKTQTINVFRKHKCFLQYEAFLLPNVGQTALETSFTGCLTGLDSDFIQQLKSYIDDLLKEENLFVKKVLGNDVTPSDYLNYMQEFVNAFNSGSGLVTGESLFKTRCETLHRNIVEKAMKKYHDVIDRKQNSIIYLNKPDLQSLHENAEKQAKALFEKAKKLSDFAKEYERKFHNEMKNAYEMVQSRNDLSRKNHIAGCIDKAENAYKSALTEKLIFPQNEITIYDDQFIQHISDTAKESTVQGFIKNFPDENQEDLQNLKETLEQVLLSALQPFLTTNKENADKANAIIVQECSKIYQDYETRMKRMITDNPLVDLAVLGQGHIFHLGVALEAFDKFEKPGGQHMIQEHRKHVEAELEKLSQNCVQNQKLKIESIMKEGTTALQKQAECYTEDLRSKAQGLNSAEELELMHNQAVANITKEFKELNPFPETVPQHELLNSRLRDQLRDAYDLVKREKLDEKRRHEEKIKKECMTCVDLYKQEMDALKADSEFFEEDTLLEAHENHLNNAISSFDDATANDTSEVVEIYRTQLESAIEEKHLKLKTENDKEVELVKSRAKNWIGECLKEYQETMREPTDSCEREEEFTREHEKMKIQAIKSFNSKWSYKSNAFRREFVNELIEEIDETFVELLDMFEFRRNSDKEKTTAVKDEVRKYYHEEMATHFRNHEFIQTQIMRNSHEKASQSAIARCIARVPLKDSQILLLKQALERSFKKYDDENTMKLNWEKGCEPAIGIDLGTTYCCVAVFYQGKTIVIRNAEGRNTTPSYVAFTPDGKHSIGQPAKDNAFRNAENTVYDAKRIIGRSMQDEQLQNDMNYWPFSVVNGENGPAIEIYKKQYPPEQISAFLLKQLAAQAEKIIGVKIRKAVITVPAYFIDGQRAATVDAGEMAGLEVLQILDEPTAAALAYKLERFKEDARKVLIFDLGGGTFDISILEMDAGNIRILNKDGDTHLGGEDFDKAMMQYCAEEFKRVYGIDPLKGKNSIVKTEKDAAKQRLRRLQTYCERAKIELATTISATISVDAFYEGIHLKVVVTRQKFEELNAALFQKTIEIVERSLRQIGLSKSQIDDIVLVGGSTRIPKMQQMLSTYFDGKALNHKVNPDEAVAYGAAVQAALLNGTQAKNALNFGVIEDVTPMTLGIKAIVDGVPGVFSRIIPKNTKIPTTHKKVYYTSTHNQEAMMIKIYQGESSIAHLNTLLGEFLLTGIPPAPAGEEDVDIIMEIDTMGVLNVKAVVKSTRGQQSLKIGEKRTGRMSQTTKQKLLLEVRYLNTNSKIYIQNTYRNLFTFRSKQLELNRPWKCFIFSCNVKTTWQTRIKHCSFRKE
ncbi:Heat shock 70 kDa protein cognate 4, partial [Orchesella cincta]